MIGFGRRWEESTACRHRSKAVHLSMNEADDDVTLGDHLMKLDASISRLMGR